MRNIEAKMPPPVHVVAGIIRHSKNASKIFFTRRRKGQHLEDLWEFPGGKVEKGESRFHALQRELKEETGIQVHSALPFHSLVHQYKDKTVYLDVWEIKQFSGRPHGREGQESAWLKLTELSEYLFPEADEPILMALSLPSQLLITPDLSVPDLDFTLLHFSALMQKYRYPLVLFKSHHLDNKKYLNIANKLEQICRLNKSELIINRPNLNALKEKCFDSFQRRHINLLSAENLICSPFDRSIKISACCHGSDELAQAEKLHCDFALLSPVNKTEDILEKSATGWYQFNKITSRSRVAVFAMGGVCRKDLAVARFQGAIGVAGICDFWSL